MKTINKLPPARQSRTCVLTTKALTRLRHSLVPSTPSRFKPSTPPPTHASDTPPHSHIFITHCKIRHYATAISSIQARFVVMYTFLMQNPRTMNARLIPGFVHKRRTYILLSRPYARDSTTQHCINYSPCLPLGKHQHPRPTQTPRSLHGIKSGPSISLTSKSPTPVLMITAGLSETYLNHTSYVLSTIDVEQ